MRTRRKSELSLLKWKRRSPKQRPPWLKVEWKNSNEAFNQLQSASHKLAEALYQQTGTPGAEAGTEDQASAAGASSAGGAGEDNVIDAEYVDVDDDKK